MGLSTGIVYVGSGLMIFILSVVSTKSRLGLGIVGHYFQKRRAFAVGIVSSGSALGRVVFIYLRFVHLLI